MKVITDIALAYKASDAANPLVVEFSRGEFHPLFSLQGATTPKGGSASQLNELVLRQAPIGAYVERFGRDDRLRLATAGYRKISSNQWMWETKM